MALVRPCERFLVILKRPALSKCTYSYSTIQRESAGRALPKVTLYSKPTGCSLCVVAKKALTPYANRLEFVEVDITLPENKPWFEKYKYEIPVVHFCGQFLMKHRVDTKLLERTLDKWEKENASASKP